MITATTSAAMAFAATLALQAPVPPPTPVQLSAERMALLRPVVGKTIGQVGIEAVLTIGTQILKTYPDRTQTIDFGVSAISDDPNERLLSQFCAHALNVVEAPEHKLFLESEKILVPFNGKQQYVPMMSAGDIDRRIKAANDFIRESARACGYEITQPSFSPAP